MHRHSDLERLFAWQIHRRGEAGDVRDVAVAERAFPLLVDRLLGVGGGGRGSCSRGGSNVGVAIVEFLDANITELMVAWSDAVYTRFGCGQRKYSFPLWTLNTPGRMTYMQSHSLVSHSLHILGLDGSNSGSSVAMPTIFLSIVLTDTTLSKSPPSTRLSVCSSTTKKGMFAPT
jgi:hypothetical protein